MEQTPLFTQREIDDTPFPLLIAKHFNFPLAYHESGDEAYYAIQDWLRGLMGKQDVRSNLGGMRTSQSWEQISKRVLLLSYETSNEKTQQREFTTELNLILILDRLRTRRATPVVEEAKRLWVDYLTTRIEIRRKVLSSFSPMPFDGIFEEFEDEEETTSPIHMIDIGIQNALESGVSIESLSTMFNSKLRIPHLLDELHGQLVDPILPKYYDIITEEIYRGLWKRSPKRLKLELGLASVSSLSERMPYLARLFHGIVKNAALYVLSQQESLWWADIRSTVREYSRFFGRMAKEISEFLGKDLATGLPLPRP